MDLIAQALSKREKLKAELDRVEVFLSMAYELQGERGGAVSGAAKSLDTIIEEPTRRAEIVRAPAGIGTKTGEVVTAVLRQAGNPMSTRELVPLVLAHDIEIGGKDAVATLSARLSNYAKTTDALVLIGGRWFLKHPVNEAQKEEAVDISSKDTPTASLFNASKENDAMPPP